MRILRLLQSRTIAFHKQRTVSTRRRRCTFEHLEKRRVLAAAFNEFIDPNPAAGNQFGAVLVPLSTGNVVITSPYDDAGGTDAGAVYLFNGATGALISTLKGSTANDLIGSSIKELTNGSFVISSPNWDNGGAVDAGAATWVSGTTGLNGVLSSANSLVGVTSSNSVSNGGVTPLDNGNYVVNSYFWDNGATIDVGAVTWGSGTSGVKGAVTSTNSLIGSRVSDFIGLGGVTALPSGHYVVKSPNWDNGTSATDAGAVTWGSGTTGVIGGVSSGNSLVGGVSQNKVGSGGVKVLTNGNYVVISPFWDNTASFYVGAVTWGIGSTGVKGVVTASNSLVGSKPNDNVGSGGVTALTGGNYVVNSSSWDNGTATDAGAVTWGNGSSGIVGMISASNSLIGNKLNDRVGHDGTTLLTNGNYVVRSSNWNNAAIASAGAVTWGSGAVGVKGVVSVSNSLVGGKANDNVGSYGVTSLTNNNYVVSSPNWDNGTATNAGAVTWGNGATGIVGAVSATNSLVGSSTNNQIGSSGVTALANGNYVAISPSWDSGSATDAGAATWGNGTSGIVGAVTAVNSFVGQNTNDSLGSKGVTSLSNGNYVIASPNWDSDTIVDVGAVTWANGTTGIIGSPTVSNSLIGNAANQNAGSGFVTALTNGNFVVTTPNWDTDTKTDVGAVTWGNGSTGRVGQLGPANSFTGISSNDKVGHSIGYYYDSFGVPYPYSINEVIPLSDGNYIFRSPNLGNSEGEGAVTFGDGATGLIGLPSASNSVFGGIAYAGLDIVKKDDLNQNFYVRFLNELSGVVRVGSQIDGFPKMGATLVAGNLTINARDGANNLTIRVVGSNLEISDPLELFEPTGTVGTLTNLNHTLTISLNSITGSITINGERGDDSLTVDLINGDPISSGGLVFNGNGPTVALGNTLKIIGGNQGTATYNYVNASDGAVVLSNYGTITYTELESVFNSGSATDAVFNLPANVGEYSLSDDGVIGNSVSRLLGLGFESTYFANPLGMLEVRRGNVNDKLLIHAIPDLTSSLLFGSLANPFQKVEFKGPVSLASNKSVTAYAQNVTSDAPLVTTTGDVMFNATNDISVNHAVVTGGGLLTLNADSDSNGSGALFVETPVFGDWSMPATASFLSSTGSLAGDSAGGSVAISKDGNTAIVGSYLDDAGLNVEQGSAIVYIRSGGVWVEQTTLTSMTGAAGDRFGNAVALSSDGNTAVVGAYIDDEGANANEGSVTVFVRVAGLWTQQAFLTASDGEASDGFGISVDVSNDGNTLVVGAYLDNVGSYGNAGSVTIFTRTGSTWSQQAKVVAADGLVDDRLGYSVAVSGDGNTLISGAYLDDIGTATRRGSAYVFTKSGVTWTQQTQLLASDGLAQDRFGTSVDLSDNGATAIVGSYLAEVGANINEGAAYIYSRSGTTWSQQSKLTAADGAASDYFGYYASISGDGNTALVGSRLDDVLGNVDQGSATIFTRNGISWTQRNQLFAVSGSAGGNFGIVAALDGDGATAIIGAYIDDVGTNVDQGSASIFDRAVNTPGGILHSGSAAMNLSGVTADLQGPIMSVGGDIAINTTNGITLRSELESGGGNVTLNADSDANGSGVATVTTASFGLFADQQSIIDSIGGAGDSFGRAVAISVDGNTAIVGGYLDDVGANVDQGSAKVFVRSGDTWVQQQQLFATGGTAGDRFGYSVALSGDGNTAIVGAYFDTVAANAEQGSVLIFERSGNVWTQQQQLTAPAGATGDRFGYSVALSHDGNTAIAGAYTDDVGSNSNQGSAYIFTRAGSVWTHQKQVTAIGGAANDNFGISVALSSNGSTAIIGAYADDVGSSTNQGSAVVFTRTGSVWIQQQQIIATDGASSDLFGLSVALSADGNTALVGSYRDDTGLNIDQGSAYFYTRSGSMWTQQQQVVANDGAALDLFGYSVDLSSDGNTAVIGATFVDVGANAGQGSAIVYKRTAGGWMPQQQFSNSGGSASDNFGISVGISGDSLTLIVGAELDDVGVNVDQGSAYVFTRKSGSIDSSDGNVSITAVDVKLEGTINAGSGYVSLIPVSPALSFPAAHAYELNSSFNDTLGGPAIASGGGILGETGYSFAAGQGPSLSNALIDPAEYSILMRFSLSSLTAANGSPYVALLGFTDTVNDTFFHRSGNGLILYPSGTTSGGSEFTANQVVEMVVTREASTNQFKAYINGSLEYSVLDAGGRAIFAKADDLIRFFVDSGTLGEVQGGFLDRVRVYDEVLTAAQVANVFSNIAPVGSIGLGANGTGTFNLTDAELDRITAAEIAIGDINSGEIKISEVITRTSATNLVLTNGGTNSLAFVGTGNLDANRGHVTISVGFQIISGIAANDVIADRLSISSQLSIGTLINPLSFDVELLSSSSPIQFLAESNTASIAEADLIGSDIRLMRGFYNTTPDGSILGNVTVSYNVGLFGTGTTGTINVESSGTVRPGSSLGILNSEGITFASDSFFFDTIQENTVAPEYGQLKVTGAVNLGSANLVLVGNIVSTYVPIVLIDNDGVDPIVGTFNGYSEGSPVTVNGQIFFISYVGGTGNDVVLFQNHTPSAIALSLSSVLENVASGSTIGTLITTDPDQGDTFTYTFVAGSGVTDNEAFTIVGDELRIINSPDFEMKSSFSVRVRTTDPVGLFFEKELLINVIGINEAPMINYVDSLLDLVTTEDGGVTGLVVADDVERDTLTYSLYLNDLPQHGTAVLNGATFDYTANADFNGVETFSILVSDGNLTASALVTVVVEAVNDAPFADPQTLTINENGSVAITLTGSDVDGDSLTYVIVSGPNSGTLTGTAPNLVYAPSQNGIEALTFKVNDGTLDSAVVTVLLETRPAPLPDIAPLRDINSLPTTASSDPRNFVDVDGTVFFSARTPTTGFELWKSDGTEAGTVLVKDIYPGTPGSQPRFLTNVNGTLFFGARDVNDGYELWKSDGTETGTVLVKDINPGIYSSEIYSLTNVNGTLFFRATNSFGSGYELWKSDGTETGTIRVKDIFAGSNGSNPSELFNLNGTLYFAAQNSTNGRELWKSDGSETGTVQVKDISTGGNGSDPESLTNVNGTLFFVAEDAGGGVELWKSDGTEIGTVRVKDIFAGASGSQPNSLTNVNGTLYFRAYNGINGSELWSSDGTEAGTAQVKDIFPGTNSSDPVGLTNVNGTLFFSAYNNSLDRELWKSDGTETGTVLVKDIIPGSLSSNPQYLTNVGGTLYFRAVDPDRGRELWKSDGTETGTTLALDIANPGGSNPSSLTVVGNQLFFAATTNTYGQEIYVIATNAPPVDLALSPATIDENSPSGSTIGTFTTTDPDSGDTFTYTLVSGTGDEDNASFQIVGSQLQTNQIFDFETKNSFSIRVRTTDQGQLSVDKEFTITVTNVNEAPTNITLSNSSVAENAGANAVVGTLAGVDPDAGAAFTFSLPANLGSNGLFNISGTSLRATASLNFEGQASHIVTVRVSDGALTFDEQFTITVTNVNEAPINITLSNSSVAENAGANAVMGTLVGVDPDAGAALTFSLPAGLGSNNLFNISGTSLRSNNSFDFESASNYGITVRATDADGLFTEQTFTISVVNLLDGTSGIDEFVIAVDVNSVSITRTTNGATPVAEGTFSLTSQLLLAGLTITGLGSNDTVKLLGLTGNDSFSMTGTAIVLNGLPVTAGLAAKVTLDGGAGDDVYRFNADQTWNNVTIIDSAGMDTVDFSATTVNISANLGVSSRQTVTPGLRLSVTPNTIENLIGGSGNDTLFGNALNNRITGNAGNDTIHGLQGDDTLLGGLGDDIYVFAAATAAEVDTVTESSNQGTDTLNFAALTTNVAVRLNSSAVQAVDSTRTLKLNSVATFENLIGGSGNDTLIGNALNNRITGNAGNDTIHGLQGDDTLLGGLGDDVYVFGTATSAEADTVTEASNGGTDTLSFNTISTPVTLSLASSSIQEVHTNRTLKLNSGSTFENAAGGPAGDSLTGNSLANVLIGNAGDDVLVGGAGRDILIGGIGRDTLNGGTDDDILIAGRTTSDALFANLNGLRADWLAPDLYANRVSKLRAGVGTPTVSLKAKTNVLKDSSPSDSLTGGSGTDWFFKAVDDALTDLLAGEELDLL